MYSIEMDHDEIVITVMDDSGNYEDLIINSFDDIVYIRQWEENKVTPQAIAISPAMWEELISAMDSPSGFFKRVNVKK
jgi:hypothetical protein|tara:strand:- start:8003 stop:8236 length:234 start_codon:yes stop_codon:yes gene_type:complete